MLMVEGSGKRWMESTEGEARAWASCIDWCAIYDGQCLRSQAQAVYHHDTSSVPCLWASDLTLPGFPRVPHSRRRRHLVAPVTTTLQPRQLRTACALGMCIFVMFRFVVHEY